MPECATRARRAFAYLVPYWRRLVAGARHQPDQHRHHARHSVSVERPDRHRAGRPRSRRAAAHRLLVRRARRSRLRPQRDSGLRYTRVSAEILFDMRLVAVSRTCSGCRRASTRARGSATSSSRLNNDISEIQRVAAEAALAWVGNVLFLVGSLVMMVWLDWRLVAHRAGADADQPVWRWCITGGGSRAASPSCGSAAPTSAAS